MAPPGCHHTYSTLQNLRTYKMLFYFVEHVDILVRIKMLNSLSQHSVEITQCLVKD